MKQTNLLLRAREAQGRQATFVARLLRGREEVRPLRALSFLPLSPFSHFNESI